MTTRNWILPAAAMTLLGVAMLGGGWSTAESADQAKLPGDAGPGPYAQGCVDCHVAEGAGDIGTLLAAMRHPNVDDDTKSVPGDCTDCHSDEVGFTPLGDLSHMLHYENPAENAFVQEYGGNCLHCHAIDVATGTVTVKSGPKNW